MKNMLNEKLKVSLSDTKSPAKGKVPTKAPAKSPSKTVAGAKAPAKKRPVSSIADLKRLAAKSVKAKSVC